MTSAVRPFLLFSLVVPLLIVACWTGGGTPAQAAPKPDSYWQVDDVRAGMKGTGRTVMKGTKVETFQAEVLGVLKNTSPGRDLVLCRLSGLNLEKTGVIAGMSGSPVYIDGKLVGAVAYAWPFGKEPIAGITPFSQMHGFVEAFERRDLVEDGKPTRVGLRQPLVIDGKEFDTVTVSQGFDDSKPAATDGLWMMPLRTPLAATGFTRQQPEIAERALRQVRHDADARRRRAGAHRRGGEGRAAGAGQSVGRLADQRRLRPVRHRHRHARRGQPRLRLGPSVHEPRRLRVPADDRLHPHGLSAADGQLQDGLAAQAAGRHQRRRQHLHRRLARPQGRHAAGEDERRAGRREHGAHLQRRDRPAADAAADAGVHGPDQLGGHGRRAARGDDGRAASAHRSRGP